MALVNEETLKRFDAIDKHDLPSLRQGIKLLEEQRERLREKLAESDLAILKNRPAADEWSVLENVRHLLLAEDLYINRWILRNDTPWCPYGLPPDFLIDRYDFTGNAPIESNEIEVLFSSWDSIHAVTKAFLDKATADDLRTDTSDVDYGQGTVGGILKAMCGHETFHVKRIDRMMAW
jgi:uncharacterized damage-inducible protein DinB